VGRDHHRWYLREVPQLFTAALGGAEAALNPAGIMNPGVLMQPARTANYHHEREGERQ
jgi:alkyldihydroxyacetonephosphate synthase